MRPMDGYPDSFGAKRVAIIPHQGPTLYAPVTPGVAPANATTGDRVNASEAGMKYIDFVEGGLTDSGVYRVEAIPPTRSGYIANPQQIGTPTTYYTLRWVVVATGAEAAAIDLDAEIVRLKITGPK